MIKRKLHENVCVWLSIEVSWNEYRTSCFSCNTNNVSGIRRFLTTQHRKDKQKINLISWFFKTRCVRLIIFKVVSLLCLLRLSATYFSEIEVLLGQVLGTNVHCHSVSRSLIHGKWNLLNCFIIHHVVYRKLFFYWFLS